MESQTGYNDPIEMKQVVNDSDMRAWQYFDAPPTWVLTTDRDFSITLLKPWTSEDREVEQPDWANIFPNPKTERDTARVRYRGAPFDQLQVLRLDEYRATVVHPKPIEDPEPEQASMQLTDYEWKLSRVMSRGDHLDGYSNGLDVEVVENEF